MLFQCIQLINFFRGEPKHTIKQGPDGQLFWLFYVFGVLYFDIRVIKEANRRKAVLNNSPKWFFSNAFNETDILSFCLLQTYRIFIIQKLQNYFYNTHLYNTNNRYSYLLSKTLINNLFWMNSGGFVIHWFSRSYNPWFIYHMNLYIILGWSKFMRDIYEAIAYTLCRYVALKAKFVKIVIVFHFPMLLIYFYRYSCYSTSVALSSYYLNWRTTFLKREFGRRQIVADRWNPLQIIKY